jgi:valacyclovir hydrolase
VTERQGIDASPAGRLQVVERGRGENVLLLPGFTEGVEEVSGLFDLLARDHHVIAIALPGSGGSGPIPRAYHAGLYEEDVELITQVIRQRGIASTVVAGFSDGGEVALLMAARHPSLVRAVVAWGAAGVVPASIAGTIADVGNVIDRPREGWAEWRATLIARYGIENARATTTSWSRAVLALLDAGGDISLALAPTIRCPVLLIAGERDPFAPPADVRRLGSSVTRSTVHLVPGVGHAVHQASSEWFQSTVRGWLDLVSAPEGDLPPAV